jgi:molecular chaperone DnaK
MSRVVGIDLGTTNTVVAAVRDSHAWALPDEDGQTLIPSVISFHPSGNVLVGKGARERRLVDPNNTIHSVKRLIGRSWDTDEVRRARTRLPFQMREGPGQSTLVVARGEAYTLPEISAFVLRKAKNVAESALGEGVERAVITVPANFNDLQRAATKVAGRVAGLDVLRILNEPTAAALAYGYGKSAAERIAVYDFGGGTFDVTLLDLSNNVFEVLSTAGNTFLGGDDIDLLLAERIADAFLKQHRYDPRTDPIAFDRLRLAAESLKRTLSNAEDASIEINELSHGPGGKPLSLRFSFTRIEFERLCAPVVDQTFDVCRDALDVARLKVDALDQVLLVGGSTRIPLVKRRVEEFFRRDAKSHISPDEVVAIGAAIQASAISGAERKRGTVPPPPAPARRTSPSIAPQEGRLRLSSIPDPETSGPMTRPIEGTRPTSPEHAGHEAAAAERRTMLGLGNRARAKTGAGLGPDAAVAQNAPTPTLPLVGDAAAEARRRVAEALEPAVVDEPSAAFMLEDADLEVAPEPAAAPPPSTRLSNTLPLAEAELPLPEVPDDEDDDAETFVGKSPLRVSPRPPMATLPGIPPSDPPPPLFGLGGTLPLDVPAAPPAPEAGWSQTQPLTRPPERPAPVLVDVTPLTLAVETVGGYCDTIIERNTPVPCERTREFATVSDNQTHVRVRVSQGESSRFASNTLLGELELAGLRPAPRGQVQITVTFALDENGMLNVRARDSSTGRATQAQIRLIGLPGYDDVESLAARHAGHRF